MESARQRTIAIVLAGVALVLAGIATIVVITRSSGGAAVAEAPRITVDDRDVPYDTLHALDQYDAFVEAGNGIKGVRVKDGALATKLGLQGGDAITGLNGRPTLDTSAARRAAIRVVLDEHLDTVYVELARGDHNTIARWHVTDRPAKTAQTPSPYTPTPFTPPPPDSPDPLVDAITQIDDTHVEITSSGRDQVLANPLSLAKQARIVPSMKDGHPNGFKLYAIRPSSAVRKLGFANGDTLEGINGYPLTSADKALEVYTKLRNATKLDVDLDRRGQPMTIHITIK